MPFDRAAIEELFDYTAFTWEGVLDAVREAPHGTLTRPAPGSGWPAMRDCLGHILFGYDRWLAIMAGRPMRGYEPASAETLDELAAEWRSFRAEFRGLLDGAADDGLYEVRDFEVDGELLKYSLGELLAHLLLHERGHFGDVTTLFHQLGVDPDMGLEYRFMLGRH